MVPLSPSVVLRLWEAGASLDPASRSLAILAAASPEVPRDTLAALPVGRRDQRLFEIREATFGSRLEATLACPNCGERVEFALETCDLLAEAGTTVAATASELRLDDWSLRYRMPTAGLLAEVAGCRDADRALALLLEHCVVEARRGEEPATLEEVPQAALAMMSSALVRQDPFAELLLDFV